MPNYKVHVVGGLAVGVGALVLTGAHEHTSIPTALEYLGCAVAGSLFPDIDIKSKGQKLFYFALVCTLLILLWQHRTAWFIAVSMLGMTPLLMRHRGLSHHPWFIGALVGIPATYLYAQGHPTYNALAVDLFYFALGALSHILLDIGLFRTCKKVWLK